MFMPNRKTRILFTLLPLAILAMDVSSDHKCAKLRATAIRICQKHGEKSQACITATKSAEECK